MDEPLRDETAANENGLPTWDGHAPNKGWHWLKRKGGGLRMAFSLTGSDWRVADGIGRTAYFPAKRVAKMFDYVAPVEPPARSQPEDIIDDL